MTNFYFGSQIHRGNLGISFTLSTGRSKRSSGIFVIASPFCSEILRNNARKEGLVYPIRVLGACNPKKFGNGEAVTAMHGEYWNKEIETLSEDEYHFIQEKALFKELRYVWDNSSFYQEKLTRAGVELGDIRGLEDLGKLPFTEKSELRDSQLAAPPLGTYACVPIGKVKRVYSTSGTTGRPTYIGLTKHDIEVWKESATRGLWCMGLRPGSIVPLVVAPYFIAGSYLDAIENVGTSVPVGVGATERLTGAFQNIGANTLWGTTSMPKYFAESLRRRGIDPKSLGIRIVLAGGEPGASVPSYRKEIEETFGCIMLELMGNGDICGMMWAECKYKRGMHFIAQGIVHPEIIDPETLQPLDIKEGITGELVYTSIDRECQPLIRFRTRDHVEVTQTGCECGRTSFGIRCVGRTDDMIIVSGVNVYPSAVRDVVASFVPRTTGAIEIQILKPPPEGWSPPIRIKAEHGQEPGDLNRLKEELENVLREKLVFRSHIELVPPDSLPKYEYKAKLVRKAYEDK
jgi:phenylacetate-CoA ligase